MFRVFSPKSRFKYIPGGRLRGRKRKHAAWIWIQWLTGMQRNYRNARAVGTAGSPYSFVKSFYPNQNFFPKIRLHRCKYLMLRG